MSEDLKLKAKSYIDANIWDGEDRSGAKNDSATFTPDDLQDLIDDLLDYIIEPSLIPCKDRLPEPSDENKLQSVKVINQDGDSVYYSYGYKRWVWYLSVNHEEENAYPVVTSWAYLPPKPESE